MYIVNGSLQNVAKQTELDSSFSLLHVSLKWFRKNYTHGESHSFEVRVLPTFSVTVQLQESSVVNLWRQINFQLSNFVSAVEMTDWESYLYLKVCLRSFVIEQ